MTLETTTIQDLVIINPAVFNDERGYFFEAYNKEKFTALGISIDFVQDNQSFSKKGTLRGLHYQIGEYSQAKLVRALKGSVLDVVVDLRKSSPTFGEYLAVELTDENKKQLFMPRGIAHGFLVLSQEAIFSYKVDNVYAPAHEASLLWSDPSVAINWGIDEKELILSPKDKAGKLLSEAILFD